LAKNASFVVFIGSEELKAGTYKLKNLDTNSETEITKENLLKLLKD